MPDSSNYDWNEYPAEGLRNRFPHWVIGYDLWSEMADHLESREQWDDFLDGVAVVRQQRRPGGTLPEGVMRVFVSHKQQDRSEALRAAWIATQVGRHYWLDILDPTLAGTSLNPFQIAAVIEMALLNCTHVLALITSNSDSSRWIPYEYGRVKEPSPYALNAACWLHPARSPAVAEYLYLGAVTKNEADIRHWLSPSLPPIPWSGPPTQPLP